MTADDETPTGDSKYSPMGRAARIFSVLQGTLYITEPLSALSSASRHALIDAIATLVSQGTSEGIGRNIIQLIQSRVPGFSEYWFRLEAVGSSEPRLRIVEVLARGEYQ